MRARRFQGPTVSAAYEQVRAVLGDDAVIISTRNATAPGELGSGAREFVEVVAGIPETAESDRDISLRPLAQDIAAHDLVRGLAEQAAARAAGTPEVELAPPFLNSMAGSARGGPFDAIGRGSAEPSGQPPTSAVELPEALDHALLANLSAGLQEVRALLEQLTRERLTAPVEVGAATLAELRDCLLTHGVRHSLLLPLLDDIAHSITPDASGEAVQQAAETALEAQLPPPITLDLARRPHAIFIVGPAGAGKTTAAIRLGMQLTQQGLRVAVAGTNVERAGAPQQLEAFGAAAGLRVRTCYTPGELQALIADGASDVVIVDTVGHNGARTDRMAELGAFLQVARERTVLLALPATMQGEDLLRLTRAFARVHPGGLLLTRCDETETFGGLWSAVKQCGVGIAYTTHNDAVGELAHPGDNHALAAAVQQGQWPARVTASSFGRRAGSCEGKGATMPAYVDLRVGQRISVLRGANGLGAARSSTIRHVTPVSVRIDMPPRDNGASEFEVADEIMIMVDLQGKLYTFASCVQQVDAAADSLLIDRPSIVRQSERRQFFRLGVSIRPKYAAIVDEKGDERRRLDVILLDLSGGGTQLRAKQPIDVGDRVHLVFPLDDEDVEADVIVMTTSTVEAEAPWMHRANGRFIGLVRQMQERIIRYIFRQQVALLKRGVL